MMNLATLPPDKRERILAGAWREARSRRQAQAALIASAPKFKFRGGNRQMYEWRGVEGMVAGPASTGKTIACLALLDKLAREVPGSQWGLIRKTRADMDSTVLVSYRDKVLGKNPLIHPYGGEKPEFFQYPNGSRVWIGGMDKPGKVLSGERDGVCINQAEELELSDWETLLTRTTGRAGHLKDSRGVPFGMLWGDCNPGPPTHWIFSRQMSGRLSFFQSTHKDNPALYDDAGNITAEGQRTVDQLDRLTGYRRSRLRDGLWVQAEGVVFDTWADGPVDGNVTEDAEYVPDGGEIYWAADDGYSAGSAQDTRGIDANTGSYVADAHPRAIFLCQMRADGQLNVFAESYHCLKLSDQHLDEVKALGYPDPEYVSHGPGQAEIRGRIMAAGLAPRQCMARVDESIKEMQSWLAKDENGRRLLRVHPRCRHLRGEMLSYAYDPANPDKPIKAFDHGPDALRGLCWTLRHQR